MREQRRHFLHAILASGFAATVGAVIYPVLRFIMPPVVAESAEMSVTAARVDELPPNSARIFKFGQRPGLLIRTSEGEWRAFSAICTHLNCTVNYDSEARVIVCACHNGQFDLTGRNIVGPPPRPLEPYNVNVRGEVVVVSKV